VLLVTHYFNYFNAVKVMHFNYQFSNCAVLCKFSPLHIP